MAEVIIKLGHTKNIQVFQHGDLLAVRDDGHVWGRFEDKSRWVREGLGFEDHDVDRRYQTAQNWPGGFLILKIRGISVAGLLELFEPHRDGLRRLQLTFDTTGLDLTAGDLKIARDVFLSRMRKK